MQNDTAYETYWMAILSYMLEFVDGTDLLDETMLQERYRRFYHALRLAEPAMFRYLMSFDWI